MTSVRTAVVAEQLGLLDAAEARALTDRIKQTAERLWSLLEQAHDRQAWRALGYSTWNDYVRAEFDMSKQQSFRLLDQARVIRELTSAAESPMGDSEPVQVSEREARDLKPHLHEVTDAVRDRVEEAREADPKTTPEQAADVAREVVQEHREAIRQEPAGAPRRRPLPDTYRSGVSDLWKSTERLMRLVEDDRYRSNASTVTQMCAPELLRSMTALTGVVGRLDPVAMRSNEEARHWWVAGLDDIGGVLDRLRTALQEDQT